MPDTLERLMGMLGMTGVNAGAKPTNKRNIGRYLANKRIEAGLSEHGIVDRTDFCHKKVIDIERAPDGQQVLGDISDYAKALGLKIHITFRRV